MDKFPKFRRKPKPPAIHTGVHKHTDGGVDGHYHDSDGDQPLRLRIDDHSHSLLQQHHQNHMNGADSSSAASSPSGLKVPKTGYFAILKRHKNAKRARDSPSSDPPTSPLPPLSAGHESAMSTISYNSNPSTAHESRPNSRPGSQEKRGRPAMPAFLELSEQDIDQKFNDIQWAERERIHEGTKNIDVPDYKWGTFSPVDTQGKSIMDRYANIKPWNHNRVKLQVPDGELNYVNASAISLQSPSDSTRPPLRYIAMQGPTVPSVDYVWRMIAEQMEGTAVIVQLTGMVEGAAVKCHQYFPNDPEQSSWILNEGDAWGDGWLAQLTLDSTEILADGAIEKRKLFLHVNGEEEREPLSVWHFLYLRWPDFGVPTGTDLESFFALMKLSREYTFHANPRVVHCSAGVGRTGTFIALEHLIRELEMGALEHYDTAGEAGPDLVFDTVDKLREQRRAMVQGEVQFEFIYSVLRTMWQEKHGPTGDGLAGGEPAAKRLEMLDGDPFTDKKPTPAAEAGAVKAMADGGGRAEREHETR